MTKLHKSVGSTDIVALGANALHLLFLGYLLAEEGKWLEILRIIMTRSSKDIMNWASRRCILSKQKRRSFENAFSLLRNTAKKFQCQIVSVRITVTAAYRRDICFIIDGKRRNKAISCLQCSTCFYAYGVRTVK